MSAFKTMLLVSLSLLPIRLVLADSLADFYAGSGLGAGNTISAAIEAALTALFILWAAWLVVGAFRSWSAGQSDSITFVSVTLRSVLMFVVVGSLLIMFD